MKPGDMPYNSPQGYGANKVAAEQVLLDSGMPVTVLRPSKVHGEGAAPPREWYFVKRDADGHQTRSTSYDDLAVELIRESDRYRPN